MKKPREEMTAAEKRADTNEVKRFLKEQTGSTEGQPGAAKEFMDLLKRAVKPRRNK